MSLRRNLKKEHPGNWRCPEKWSTAAEEAMNSRRKDDTIEVDINPAFTRYVGGYYCPLDSNRVIRLTNTLVTDIYRLNILPKKAAKLMVSDPEMVNIIKEDLYDLLMVYGNHGLIYATDYPNIDMIYGSYILKGGDVFLVPNAGMPVKEFLFWYIGVLIPNEKVLNEWSGIPGDQLQYVYQQLLEFFRNEICFEYRMYNRRPTDEPEDHA